MLKRKRLERVEDFRGFLAQRGAKIKSIVTNSDGGWTAEFWEPLGDLKASHARYTVGHNNIVLLAPGTSKSRRVSRPARNIPKAVGLLLLPLEEEARK